MWLTDPAGRHRTLWVSLSGAAIASQPIDGPLWAWEGTLWQWIEEPVEVQLHAADEADETPRPSDARSTVLRGVLRELVADQRVEVVAPPVDGVVREIDHRLSLLGSVGPFVFVNETTYVDSFGAHGASESRAVVWDLRAAAPADLLTDRERFAIGRGPAARARELLARASEEAALGDEELSEGVELVAVRPVISREGVAVQLRFATTTCYACSDGSWSDYMRSVEVEPERVPERLAPYASVPEWVRVAAATLPDHAISGFTRVTHEAPSRVLDSLHR